MSRKWSLFRICAALAFVGEGSAPFAREPGAVIVAVEENVTTWTEAGNGASPLWSYGAPLIVRDGSTVSSSVIETAEGLPPPCNVRWQIWQRGLEGTWRVAAQDSVFREREPTPIGVLADGSVLISTNPPKGETCGSARPVVRVLGRDDGSEGARSTESLVWPDQPTFNHHFYRGLAVDASTNQALVLHLDAKTDAFVGSWRSADGGWRALDPLVFQVRAAYPQIALRGGAAHVLAVSDTVEPVAAWRQLKLERSGRQWDYVFRRLFYSWSPDLEVLPFAEPIEIATVDSTGGHITNLDLHVNPATQEAHLLWLQDSHADARIREEYFPESKSEQTLRYALIRRGKPVSTSVLAGAEEGVGLSPVWARFHIFPDQQIQLIIAGREGADSGKKSLANYFSSLAQLLDGKKPRRLPLQRPFVRFFTSAPRGGSTPSRTIDLFGRTEELRTLRYARIRIDRAWDSVAVPSGGESWSTDSILFR